MRRDQERPVGGLSVTALLAAVLLAAAQPARSWADEVPQVSAKEGIAIGGSVTQSTITNTVNQENPATLAMLAKALGDKDASEEKRRAAEAKVAELATKWGFTSAAVAEVFNILGEQGVPEEKAPARLIEIATHFAQTRDVLAALEPDDSHAAELARQAKGAFDAGRLVEADTLLERAKDSERAALREASRFLQQAQEAVDRHALNLAKMEATQGDIALTQLHYADAANHYEVAARQLPSGASDQKAFYLGLAGDVLQTYGNLAAAMTNYQASHEIFERLAKADPGNAGWQRDLSVSHNKIGDVQQAQGNLTAALTSYQASLAIRDRLAKADPGNAGWQRDLSVSHDNIGDVQQAQGNLTAALTSYQASLAIADRLAKADPGNAGWQRDLASSYGRVAFAEARRGARDAALGALGRGREVISQLARQSPDDTNLHTDLTWFDSQIEIVRNSRITHQN